MRLIFLIGFLWFALFRRRGAIFGNRTSPLWTEILLWTGCIILTTVFFHVVRKRRENAVVEKLQITVFRNIIAPTNTKLISLECFKFIIAWKTRNQRQSLAKKTITADVYVHINTLLTDYTKIHTKNTNKNNIQLIISHAHSIAVSATNPPSAYIVLSGS